jgi:hypothetical protein
VWCAVSRNRIIGPIFFNDPIKWERYYQAIFFFASSLDI